MYAGREEDAQQGLAYNVVTSICHGLFDKNHRLFMDNFYTSVPLFLELLNRGMYAVGTVRRNRKFLPKEIISDAATKALARGQSIYRRAGSLLCLTWEGYERRYIS